MASTSLADDGWRRVRVHWSMRIGGWRNARKIVSRSIELRELDDVSFAKHVSDQRWFLLAKKHPRRVNTEIYAASIEAIRREAELTLRSVQVLGAIGLIQANCW